MKKEAPAHDLIHLRVLVGTEACCVEEYFGEWIRIRGSTLFLI